MQEVRVQVPKAQEEGAEGQEGRGLIVKADDAIAQTRSGKVILNLEPNEEAAVCTPAEGDTVAIIGTNRKLLLFPLADLPEQARGRGVILQRYKDGRTSDARVFTLAQGLTWESGGRTRTESDLREWVGERAQAGRLPPRGFRSDNKFG